MLGDAIADVGFHATGRNFELSVAFTLTAFAQPREMPWRGGAAGARDRGGLGEPNGGLATARSPRAAVAELPRLGKGVVA